MLAARVDVPTDPYAMADARYTDVKQYLASGKARALSESALERELEQRGHELLRQLMQAHLDTRGPGEVAGPVTDADGVDRPERRAHARNLETVFGTVEVQRLGYAREGRESLHPLDAALNLPPERYSLEVRRRVAKEAAKRSFEEVVLAVDEGTGAEVPKRQVEALARRAAQDFEAFYAARQAQARAEPGRGSVLVLSVDGKGVVMHKQDLRAATRKAAERRRRKLFSRRTKGEKSQSKRMATVATVYTVAPFVRTPEEFLRTLMRREDDSGAKPPAAARPRPEAKRVWASLKQEPQEVIEEAVREAESRDPDHRLPRVVLVDGAERQLQLLKAITAAYHLTPTVIVDIIHVAEYVWKASLAFHTEDAPQRECWVWDRLTQILDGKAVTAAAAMRGSATRRGLSAEKRAPVDTCANYLLKYAPYLRYDTCLAAGLPIASGVIEGACRHLVRDRMELTGARWRLEGAEAVLRLRALYASGDFEAYWVFHEAREYERSHAQRYAGGQVPPVTAPLAPEPRPRLRRIK